MFLFNAGITNIHLWTHRESNTDLFRAREVFYRWTMGPQNNLSTRKGHKRFFTPKVIPWDGFSLPVPLLSDFFPTPDLARHWIVGFSREIARQS